MQTENADRHNDIERLLSAGIAAHTAGNLDEAESHYENILQHAPTDPDAMRFFGILRHQQGRSEEGVDWLRRALSAAPSAHGYNDLGNILAQRGELEAAGDAFIAAIELEPGDPNPWNNLGSILLRLGRNEDAEEAYRGALNADPDFAPALNNLADLFTSQGRSDIAAEFYCRAYIQPPLDGKPFDMLGIAHYRLGNIGAAAEAYRQWSLAEPDNPRARHMYLACRGGHGPARAEDGYVEQTFDAYAENFETKLVKDLGYRGPQMIQSVLNRIIPPSKTLDVLDGGCGTGLCGAVLAPYAKYMSGVDLSANMLAKAEEHHYYDQLHKSEITAWLAAHPESYDLIALADTIIYFGDTAELFAAAKNALRANGLFVFTMEVGHNIDDYQITPSGRYRHAPAHIDALLAAHGFAVVERHADTLRTEFTVPVPGLAVAARKV